MATLTQQLNVGNFRAFKPLRESVLEPTIHCISCNQAFLDDQLIQLHDDAGAAFEACPTCKTDQYLADLLPSPNLIDQFIASGEFDQALLEAITDLVEGKNA